MIKIGTYSNFDFENIECKDIEGLREFLDRWNNKFANKEYRTYWQSILKTDEKGKEYVTFEDWTDLKLISYWYDLDALFLKCVARYIEGTVTWLFENSDEGGHVEFKNGECRIITGVMDGHSHSPNDLLEKGFKKEHKDFILLEDL